jgi:hypothetical protein
MMKVGKLFIGQQGVDFSERDLYHFTKEQLESWGCKFDRLVVGYS